ncbi:hypothetical protein EYB25_001251 [Talaromyces marneffei]|uniref:uncharacterized protein n=1 Tax=Talaromyces marneffei TaxID=37727 RepID=UPI0012AA088E|nr:uncharacterized protein EYB26_001085 [Talaromyces marneffei]KAE8556550.1 hypothetical protein EYB25_001251 [Talaromyces marneffei]QGA13435.1 hypothetical protein EYB26_001085 [Talaromyces marneffei]
MTGLVNKGIAWETESPFLDVDYEAPNAFGVSTLKHLATKKILSDQRNLDQSHFRHIPWPIAEELWQYLTRSGKRTLYMWKIFCAAYPVEFRRLSQHCESWVGSPRYSLSGYINLIKSSNDSWATKLNIWTEFARVPELVEVAHVTNLISLEVNTSISGRNTPELQDQEAMLLNDRILRTWSELAETSGAFKHLRVLRLYHQRDLTEHSFCYLSNLPSLEYCVLATCDRMTQKSAIDTARSQGWVVVENISDQTIFQFSSLASSKNLGGETKWRDHPDGQMPASLPSDIPVLEFSVGQRHDKLRDRDIIIMRRKYTHRGNKRSLVDAVPSENDGGAPKKTRKPVMKQRVTQLQAHSLITIKTTSRVVWSMEVHSASSTNLPGQSSTQSIPPADVRLEMADQPSHAGQDPPSSTESSISSPRTSTDSRSSNATTTRQQQPPMRPPHISASPNTSHRQSFGDSLRNTPQSPRNRRQPSLTQAAIQGLIDNPPARNPADPAFLGRDWRHISIGELVKPADLRFVEVDTGIEEATNKLIDNDTTVLLVRETVDDKSAVGTFGYNDLNAYLLLVVGLAKPTESQLTSFQEVAQKAREGSKIPLKDIRDLVPREPLTTLPQSANLMTAVEKFGGGVHRIVVLKEDSDEVVGIVSQSRLVKFLWENGRSFPIIDQLYPQHLKDLRLGSQQVISINGDKPLYHALRLMNDEGISSLAIVDNHSNVVGNISTVDVKLLTKSTALPLLHNTCIHFISVILSTRGLVEGKDSFPVFYVTPTSTLAHTVAKMVATKSHRLWMTDPQSPSSSGPPTPAPVASTPPSVNSQSPASNHGNGSSPAPPPNYTYPHHPIPPQAYQSPAPGLAPSPAIPASALPGTRLSGRLVGVVSLTDILFCYATISGLNPNDPTETRNRRRRSSSSSLNMRRSGDVAREIFRGGVA